MSKALHLSIFISLLLSGTKALAANMADYSTIEAKLKSFNSVFPQDCNTPMLHDALVSLSGDQSSKATEQLVQVADAYHLANCAAEAKKAYKHLTTRNVSAQQRAHIESALSSLSSATKSGR